MEALCGEEARAMRSGRYGHALQRCVTQSVLLQCVAVCCSVLQCVAVCCSVLQLDMVTMYRAHSQKSAL